MTVAMAGGRQHAPTACSGNKPPSHIYLQWKTEKREGRLAQIGSGHGTSQKKGNTSRWALFPSPFPRRKRYIERTTLSGPLPGRSSRSPLGPTVGPADTETTTAHGRKGLVTVKIEAMNGETPEPFDYGNVFAREEVGGRARLRVGLDEAQDAAVATLARTLRGPFQLLYVLHTTRTAAELGRYESPELTSADVELFLSEFGRFLCEDSRHDLVGPLA